MERVENIRGRNLNKKSPIKFQFQSLSNREELQIFVVFQDLHIPEIIHISQLDESFIN